MKRLKMALALSFVVSVAAVPAQAEIVRVTNGTIIDTSTLTPMPIDKSKLNAQTLRFVEEVELIEAMHGNNWPNPARLLPCRPAYWENRFMPPPYNKYTGTSLAGGNEQRVCDF